MNKAQTQSLIFPGVILSIFWTYGLIMYHYTANTFFLFDLPYIGSSIAIGCLLESFLPRSRRQIGRLVTQFLVGAYMIVGLGLYLQVNMQMEQFLFYVFTLSFGGAVIHYLPAKLLGPVVFGRGWCGWGCWTASMLDLLPWKNNPAGRRKAWGALRYLHLAALAIVIGIIVVSSGYRPQGSDILVWFLVSNGLYWASGLLLAVSLKDNRAFCKYLCPIPPFQKILGRWAIFKVQVDTGSCIQCGSCDRSCPMDIQLTEYIDQEAGRINSTECILCNRCSQVCPKQAISLRSGLSQVRRERLRFK